MINLTDDSIHTFIAEQSLPVLIDIWAPWCGPCKVIAPQVERVLSENDGRLVGAKINADDSPNFCAEYGVQSIPVLLVFVGGKVVEKKVGAAGGYGAIKTLVAPHLG